MNPGRQALYRIWALQKTCHFSGLTAPDCAGAGVHEYRHITAATCGFERVGAAIAFNGVDIPETAVADARPGFAAGQTAIAIIVMANASANDQWQGPPGGFIIIPTVEMAAISLTSGTTAAIPSAHSHLSRMRSFL